MSSPTVSTKLRELATQASDHPDRVFTNLAHHLDVEFLREAYRRTKKNSSPGVDGVTAQAYAEHLDENLRALHERMRSGQYQAPPVKRKWLDKPDGGRRPIGMPAFEDKIVQRAVAMLLEQIYEHDFHDFSYGFRRQRRPHDALQELREQCGQTNTHWIIDADVSGYFDAIDHSHLREFLKQRVNDGSIMRFIGKWLNAGVLDEGIHYHPETGSPQGGVISPILANIYLHYVLDVWFVDEVQPRLQGRAFIIRFADDFVIGCEYEEDARRIMAVLPKRFSRFGLTIHPEKSHLIAFGRPRVAFSSRSNQNRQSPGSGNGTFDFLGFTHYWARSRRGYWVIKRRTAGKRLRRTSHALWEWCRTNRHMPLPQQHKRLRQKLSGHYNYFGVRANYAQLAVILRQAERAWHYWLNRRRRHPDYNWEEFRHLLKTYPLPKPKIVHSI
ncbi:MAG: group II intron reverse transcriptase/maturase [Nitrospira sp.]|nr:group II intron reverse transcriptase/maturase [Nitrospira sp.]